jgi:hypothetical protein
VSPSDCPITFDAYLAPVTTAIKDAIKVSSNATTVSYKVNSSDYLLDGVYDLKVIIYDRRGAVLASPSLCELTLIDPCKITTIIAPPRKKRSYVLQGGDLDLDYIFQVSPSDCPITFDAYLAPVTTAIKDAIKVSSNATTISYTVNSKDLTLDGVYDL